MEFDKKAVEAEGYDTAVAVLVTNSQEFLDVLPGAKGAVKAGEDLMTIV